MVKGKDFFYCYNLKLSDYLSEKGFKYITKAISLDNNKVYSMYYKTNELQKAIDEYKSKN